MTQNLRPGYFRPVVHERGGVLKLIAKAQRVGLLRPIDEDTWEVPSPTMLRAGRELVELGIPLDHALAVADSINRHTAAISKEFVKLFVKDVLQPIREGDQRADADLAVAGQAVDRPRPLPPCSIAWRSAR